MKKYVGFYHRLPHLTIEEFREHYETRHVPLVAGKIPGLVRYVRNYAQAGANASWDAMTEVWFEEDDAYRAVTSNPEIMAAIREEEAKFIDLARVIHVEVDESVTPDHLLRPSSQKI